MSAKYVISTVTNKGRSLLDWVEWRVGVSSDCSGLIERAMGQILRFVKLAVIEAFKAFFVLVEEAQFSFKLLLSTAIWIRRNCSRRSGLRPQIGNIVLRGLRLAQGGQCA